MPIFVAEKHTILSDEVKKMIERQKEEYGWEFLFIGANIDAVETASRFGIGRDRAVNYRADSQGTQVLYDTIPAPISAMRANKNIGEDWEKRLRRTIITEGEDKIWEKKIS